MDGTLGPKHGTPKVPGWYWYQWPDKWTPGMYRKQWDGVCEAELVTTQHGSHYRVYIDGKRYDNPGQMTALFYGPLPYPPEEEA